MNGTSYPYISYLVIHNHRLHTMMPPSYLTTIQVLASLVSFLSSSIMASSIAWFGLVEGTSLYRRIIFGLSISDIFQSLAFLTGPLAVPSSRMSWGAPANEVISCQANGFFLAIGVSATLLHTVFLCFYYLCKLKYRMSDEDFRNKLEGTIRAFIVVFSVVSAVVPLVLDIYHINDNMRSFCTISPVPTGCLIEPEVVGECDADHRELVFLFTNLIPLLLFSCIIVIMGMLYRYAYNLNRNIQRAVTVPSTLRSSNGKTSRKHEKGSKHAPVVSSNGNSPDDNDESSQKDEPDEESNDSSRPDSSTQEQQTTQQLTPQESLQNVSRLYHKELTLQATSYVGGLFFMYIPTMVSFSFDDPPEYLLAIAIFTLPIGGFINILVYTRPKVAVLRIAHPECSWFRGFWLVLKSGGEIPNYVDSSAIRLMW